MNQIIVITFFFLVTSAVTQENRESDIDWSKVYPRSALDKNGVLIKSEKKLSNVQIEGRLAGGTEVVPNSVPYVVALIVRFPTVDAVCQGSIINEATILTGAYCIASSIDTQVIAGAHDMLTTEPTQQRRIITTADYRIHPSYSSGTAFFNVATLLLANPLVFNEYIGPVSLPRGEMLFENFIDEMVSVPAWGQHQVLRSISQPILSDELCAQFAPSFTNNHLCLSAAGGNSPCARDDGAPATIVRGDSITIIGMFGFLGHNSCNLGIPVGLTRISSFVDWIDQNSL